MNVFADSGGVPVIKVGDDCYELVGVTEEAANVTPEDTFETCEECEGSSSDLSGSSEAPSSSFSSEVSSDVSSAAPSSEASSLAPHVIVTTYNVSYECSTGVFGVVSKNNTTCHPEDPGDLIAFNQWFWLNNSPPEGGGACAFEYHATEFTSCNPAGGPFADVPAPGSLPTDLELCLCPSDESSAVSSDACGEPDTCGTPNGDPTLLVTLTWTDADETKDWLGCTWCNGQEKTVYADTYDLYTGQITPTFTSRVYSERWRLGPALAPKLGMRRGIHQYGTGTSPATFVPSFYYFGANVTVQTVLGSGKKDTIFRVDSTVGTMTGPYMYNSDLGILSLGDMPASGDYKLLGKQKTNSYTDANGITYSWKPGAGW